MRVPPRPWIGIAVWLGYVVIVTVVGALSGVGYDHIGDSAETLFRGAALFLAIGAVYLVIVTTVLGWWRSALFETERSRHRWPIVAPAIMALSILIGLPTVDWARIDGGYLAGLLTLGVLVGFNEELVTRGLLLTGMRASVREVWVWLTTSGLFGLMHATNIISGAPVGQTMQQVVLAFLGGTAFYIVRRVTGSLVWAMVLHGAWDFTTFATGHGTVGPSVGLFLGIAGEILALVFVFWTFASAKRPADQPVVSSKTGAV
ncbi:CPBP family intramembrane glutamic endopeptidase [Leifsonia aquatica]|uniref:CPBP family intramembrane glutamic endopeptidase n=1 Tax=Leifsonia aquatica TaxID=144185 RepID=UPI00069364CC|nr:CPBP family intramembrane glutamic endopeptidase [Leifsonia aquatica]